MKKIIIVAFIAFAGSAYSQNAIEKYFSYLDQDTGITKVTVNSKMFELFSYMETENKEEEELKEAISNLESMKVIVKEDAKNPEALFKEAIKKPGKEFELLMEVDQDEEHFYFLINEKNGIVAELLMIGNSDGEFIILSLTGEIDLKQLSSLSRQLNIDHMEHLEKIEEE
ncbi:MAG: DUF4252 domain-containing protein [Schleiferiaceae bacterium]|jgi:hypothetical protein|nr:DUF4252 domain-containing protein [Schleiferiaceae bacterium]